MSGLTTGLVRRDLLDLEQRLRDSLYRVLPFEAHAVYFPRQTRSKEPEWLPDEMHTWNRHSSRAEFADTAGERSVLLLWILSIIVPINIPAT